MRLLLVEDEHTLGDNLRQYFTDQNFAVDLARNGQDAQFMGEEYPYDAAIVDLGLPDIDGIDVIRHWRSQSINFPIIILTARDRWQEKVSGLEAGADDYLAKPFQHEELLARTRALIRRSTGHAQNTLQAGPFELDLGKQSLSLRQQAISLTAYEYRVVELLIQRTGEVISKTTLTEHIYDQDFDRDSNVLEVFIGRLRKKLDPDGHLKPIETVRGQGYRFRENWH